MKKLMILGLIASVLGSCMPSNSIGSHKTFQKRKYTKGIFSEKKPPSYSSSESTERVDPSPIFASNSETFESNLAVNISSEKTTFSAEICMEEKKKLDHPMLTGGDCKDTLVFLSGKEAAIEIIEEGPEKLSYKKCGENSTIIYSISNDEIQAIKYSSGEIKVLNDPKNRKSTKKEVKDDGIAKDEVLSPITAVASLISLFTGLFWIPIFGLFFAVLAALLGLFSLKNYNKNPSRYTTRSKSFALIGIIFGSVLSVLFLILAIAVLL